MALDLNELVPQVIVSATNCPDTTALLYVRDAARKFARDSLIWDVLLGDADVEPSDDLNTPIVLRVPSEGSGGGNGGATPTPTQFTGTVYSAQRPAGATASDFTEGDFLGGNDRTFTGTSVDIATSAASEDEVVGIAVPAGGGRVLQIGELDFGGHINPFAERIRALFAPTLGAGDVVLMIGGAQFYVYDSIQAIDQFLLGDISYRLTLAGPASMPVDQVDLVDPVDDTRDFILPTDPSGVIVLISTVKLDNEAPPQGMREPFMYDKVTKELRISPRWVRSAGTVEVNAALQPVRGTDMVHDIFDEWELAIRARTLFELLKIPGKDWTDPKTGKEYQRDYLEQVSRASARRAKGNTTMSPLAEPIPFV